MKKCLSTCLTLTALLTLIYYTNAIASAQQKPIEGEYELLTEIPKSFGYPNGITHLPNGTILLGSVIKGKIYQIDRDGNRFDLMEESQEVFAGTALRFDMKTNLLWVASPDFLGVNGVKRKHRIAVIDISRKKVVRSVEIPDDGFGNDFVLDGKGGIYLTDTILGRVYHIDSANGDFNIVAESDLMKPISGSLGPAGITKISDSELIIGIYSDSKLLHIDIADDKKAIVTELELKRPIENPDGLAFDGDKILYAIEGANKSTDGKLVKIDLSQKPPLSVETIISGMDVPVNLSIWLNHIDVSESRLLHRMNKASSLPEPEVFQLLTHKIEDNNNYLSLHSSLPDNWYPESVAMDSKGRIFTGSATESNISVYDTNTKKSNIFVNGSALGLMSVQGLLVDEERDMLYACTANLNVHKNDHSRSALFEFSLANGKYINSWPLPESGLCNDITEIDKNTLLITDSLKNYILSFDKNSKKFDRWLEHELLDQGDFKANGIVFSPQDQAVYVTMFSAGKLLRIDIGNKKNSNVTEIKLPYRLNGPDAVRLAGHNRLIVFENGLIDSSSPGGITSIAIDGDIGRPISILESQNNPTSGIYANNKIIFISSYFKDIFKDVNNDELRKRSFALEVIELPRGY